MKTISVRCSIVFAAAWVILVLKSLTNCSSCVAADTLEELLPLLSVRTVLSWSMDASNLNSVTAELPDSRVSLLPHLYCDVSYKKLCEDGRNRLGRPLKTGAVETSCLVADYRGLPSRFLPSRCRWGRSETRLSGNSAVTLIKLEASILQVETVEGSTLWSENSPYHLDCDFAGLKN